MTIHDSGRIGNGFAWDKMGERAKWHRVLTVGAGLGKWGNGEFEKEEWHGVLTVGAGLAKWEMAKLKRTKWHH